MFSNVLWCFLVFCIGSFLNFPKVWSQWCNLFLGMPPLLFLVFSDVFSPISSDVWSKWCDLL